MDYKTRSYPLFSACGLNCGLCPRYHTDGASRCPGCAGEGFLTKHPTCGVLSCAQRHGLDYCFDCTNYPCAKYAHADEADSFITHRNQLTDMAKAKSDGMAAYRAALDEKVSLLDTLLAQFDDGRRKSFYCVAVNLLATDDIRAALAKTESETASDAPVKEKATMLAALLEALAVASGISLRLRKK